MVWINKQEFLTVSDKIKNSGPFLHQKEKGQIGIASASLYSEDKNSVIPSTNVSVLGLHPLPPSPISYSGSLSSNEGTKFLTWLFIHVDILSWLTRFVYNLLRFSLLILGRESPTCWVHNYQPLNESIQAMSKTNNFWVVNENLYR